MASEMDIQRIEVEIRNRPGSPLVVHQFSEKAKKEIRDKQQKKVKKVKEERKPQEECDAARYLNYKAEECIPITALKKALISACRGFDGMKMTEMRQAIFVDAGDGAMLAPILTHDGRPAKGGMREDAVTIGINTRGLTYRPEYPEWMIRVHVEFNSRMISEAQLLALFDAAGFGVGICEGRPEKSSALGWGRFIATKVEE